MVTKTKITVVGSGYVGMSLSVLLAQHNDVTVLDINASRVNKINNKQSTVADTEIELFLAEKSLSLIATLDKQAAYEGASFIIVATPTNYDADTNRFDTSSVDAVVEDTLKLNKNALVVIKSTIPVGYTKSLQKRFETDRVIFSPEFLREGKALYDNLYPSRIIVGSRCQNAQIFANILIQVSLKPEVKVLFTSSKEAESIKLFSNTYLALRVAFFNELDSYALSKGLSSKDIINGVSMDDRIGNHYNNPSFGYGGYCLPKDTKQLQANFKDIPQDLIASVITSNAKRINFIADYILQKRLRVIGFYKLSMKKDSDNSRYSSVLGVINRVKESKSEIIIYETNSCNVSFEGIEVVNNIESFKDRSDLIVANRLDDELIDVKVKVFSRDIFEEN